MEKKIVFMGTPQIAADVLQKMIDEGCNIVMAVCQPDRKTGRKGKLTEPAVKVLARRYGIPVFQPEKIRAEHDVLLEAEPDLIVTCAYGQILPESILNAPAFGCVNLHGSLLPEYRGAAPIQRAIWDGKKESGMTLMKMEKGMDTGPVLDVEKIRIDETMNTDALFEKMGEAAGKLIIRDLPVLLSGKADWKAQDDALATYAPMIRPEEELIDFSADDEQIFNQIRALSTHPGAYGYAEGKKLKILKAAWAEDSGNDEAQLQPGLLKKAGKKKMTLDLHMRRLELEIVQPEGRQAMKAADFVNGQGRAYDGVIMHGREEKHGPEA